MTDINSRSPMVFDALQQLKIEGYTPEEISKIVGVMLFYRISKVIECTQDVSYSDGMRLMARVIYRAFLYGDAYILETLLKIVDNK